MPLAPLYDRIAALPRPEPGVAEPPPPELIAFNVTVTRRMRGWKQSALAQLAGVSLSSVERVERGERVSDSVLERIGAIFGFEPGYYTSPRAPRTEAEMAEDARETYPHMLFVEVKPLRTQADLRTLSACHAVVATGPDLRPDDADLAASLIEWIDLLGFVRSDFAPEPGSDEGGRRELYADIFYHLLTIRRAGYDVIHGVAEVPGPDGADGAPWKVGVVYLALRAKDPGALKRKILLMDRRELTPRWA